MHFDNSYLNSNRGEKLSVAMDDQVFCYKGEEYDSEKDFDMEILSDDEDILLTDHSGSDSDESDEEIHEETDERIVARDKTVWTKNPPSSVQRRAASNILRSKPGLTRDSRGISTPGEAFKRLLPYDMINIAVRETNRRAILTGAPEWVDTNETEMYAFCGLLLMAGCCRGRKESLMDMWLNADMALRRPVFSATMSRNRFKEILRYIRFDDSRTRAQRRALDKLAPFREIFGLFVSNCQKAYVPTGQLYVDEQLVPFRGNCPFRVYMKSKPDKYGIKIWTLCDTANSYAWNMQIYTGKVGKTVEKEQGKRVVLDMVNGLGSGYGVTTDNFFTSCSLADTLLQQQKTLTGTIRPKRREVPKEMWANRQRPEQSSKFLFSKNSLLASYTPRKGRAVILLSTQFVDAEISSEETSFKPNVILEYNKTKGAVDTLDMMLRDYSCRRRTRRWPLLLFMHLLDMAAYNAFVLFMITNPKYEEGKSNRRKLVIQNLCLELIKALI